MTPGEVLRAAREEAGLTVTEMAERIGYERGNLYRVEQNKIGVTPDILHAYEETVGHSLDIIPTAKSRKNPEIECSYHLTATDLTIVRWCEDCGTTHVATRHSLEEPFSGWQKIG